MEVRRKRGAADFLGARGGHSRGREKNTILLMRELTGLSFNLAINEDSVLMRKLQRLL